MKKIRLGLLIAISVSFFVRLSAAATSPSDPNAVAADPSVSAPQIEILERAQNYQRLQLVKTITNRLGDVLIHTNANVIQLGSGLNRNEQGSIIASSPPQIKINEDGNAACTETSHKAYFAGSVAAPETAVLITADQKTLRVRPSLLVFHDFRAEKSVVVAETKEAQGFITDNDKVVYPNAMDGADCTIRYTVRSTGTEQDYIFNSQLTVKPEDFGFSAPSTWMELWTEIIGDHPEPSLRKAIRPGWKKATYDKIIDFGGTLIPEGYAFGIGAAPEKYKGIPVRKHWIQATDSSGGVHTYLVEEINYQLALRELRKLQPAHAVLKNAKNPRLGRVMKDTEIASAVSNQQKNIASSAASSRTFDHTHRVQLASTLSHTLSQGFCVDFITLTSSGSLTLQSDTTYFVSSDVVVTNLVVEGGTCVKFTNGATLTVYGDISCKTGSYRPAIFTSYNDRFAGETITSDGPPTDSDRIAGVALNVCSGTPQSIHNINFRYAQKAVICLNGNLTATDCQFIHCGRATSAYNNITWLKNILMYDCDTGFYGSQYTGIAEHLTFDKGNLAAGYTYSAQQCGDNGADVHLCLTNSLLTGVTNDGAVTILHGNDVVFLDSSDGIYTNVGGGSHYLAGDSPYRGVGVTTISSDLRASLCKKTTFAPIIADMTADTTLDPQASRDLEPQKDLGFHYDPIDYSGASEISASIILRNGAVLAVEHGEGDSCIAMQDGAHLTSEGSPTDPNLIIWPDTVQENLNPTWPYHDSTEMFGVAGLGAVLDCRFTHFLAIAGDAEFVGSGGANFQGAAMLRDCEFYNGGVDCVPYAGATYCITNCLFERCPASFVADGYEAAPLKVQNCLFHQGLLYLSGGSVHRIVFTNCFFDTTNIAQATTNVAADYNGYLTNTLCLTPTNGHDVILQMSTFPYEVALLGQYYQPTNSPLLSSGYGSARDAGLYYYTVLTNETEECTNAPVAIGYHYISADSNCLARDDDRDGIPDYLADPDGNGIQVQTPSAGNPNPPSWVSTTASYSWSPSLGGGLWYQHSGVVSTMAKAINEYPRPVLVGLRSDVQEGGYRFDLDSFATDLYGWAATGELTTHERVIQTLEPAGNTEYIWSMPVPDWQLSNGSCNVATACDDATPYNVIPPNATYGSAGSYTVVVNTQDRIYQYNDSNDTYDGSGSDTSHRKLYVDGTDAAHRIVLKDGVAADFIPHNYAILVCDNCSAGTPVTATIAPHGAGYKWQTPEYYAAYLQYMTEQPTMTDLSSVPTTLSFFTSSGAIDANSEQTVHTNWANLRAKRGHPKPYSIKAVILGVEPYGRAQETMQSGGSDDGTKYGTRVNQFRNKIRDRGQVFESVYAGQTSRLSTIPLGLAAQGQYPQDGNGPWFKPMLDALGGNADIANLADFTYMDMYHHYLDNGSNPDARYFFPEMVNNSTLCCSCNPQVCSKGWQYWWDPQSSWPTGVDFNHFLWMYDDVKYALNNYTDSRGTHESAVRWTNGCSEHGLTVQSRFSGNDMGSGISWALWLAESMRFNSQWDANWVLAEQGYSHAQMQATHSSNTTPPITWHLTRTPAHYVYKMAQEFYGYEYHANSFPGPDDPAVGYTSKAAPYDPGPYIASNIVMRVFRNPTDGHYHLFVINKDDASSYTIPSTDWGDWTVQNWEQLKATSYTASNLMFDAWAPETIKIASASQISGTAISVPALSINHIELADPNDAKWTSKHEMAIPRVGHSATTLANNTVLVTGGVNSSGQVSTSEIYDPNLDSWTSISAPTARQNHTATLLQNGNVLVCGGLVQTAGTTSWLGSSEEYNSSSSSWSSLSGTMNTPRAYHSATLLANGKVLVVGGQTTAAVLTATSELFDPATGSWTYTQSLHTPREIHTATLLSNGRVLVVGGIGASDTWEIYDPDTGTWSQTGQMNDGRLWHTATLLPGGQVLVAGGFRLGTAEVFNPVTATWKRVSSMSYSHASSTATLLPNGQVLVAGGVVGDSYQTTSLSEIYNPITDTWRRTGALQTGRWSHKANYVAGKVLVTGGVAGVGNETVSAENYAP